MQAQKFSQKSSDSPVREFFAEAAAAHSCAQKWFEASAHRPGFTPAQAIEAADMRDRMLKQMQTIEKIVAVKIEFVIK